MSKSATTSRKTKKNGSTSKKLEIRNKLAQALAEFQPTVGKKRFEKIVKKTARLVRKDIRKKSKKSGSEKTNKSIAEANASLD